MPPVTSRSARFFQINIFSCKGSIVPELVALTVISGASYYAVGAVIKATSRISGEAIQGARISRDLQIIGSTLAKNFSGETNFQNLSIRLPSNNEEIQCLGTGFCVFPNSDINGNSINGFYRIVAFRKKQMSVSLKLSSKFPSSSLQVRSSDNLTPLSSLFKIGDYLVLTRVQASDILKVTSSPPAGTVGALSMGRDSYEYAHVLSTTNPSLENNYRVDDDAYIAEMISMGLDISTNNLVFKTLQGTSVIGGALMGFAISYSLKPPLDVYCTDLDLLEGEFSFDWAPMNADPSCYRRIRAIRFTYAKSAQISYGQTITKAAQYVYYSNY